MALQRTSISNSPAPSLLPAFLAARIPIYRDFVFYGLSFYKQACNCTFVKIFIMKAKILNYLNKDRSFAGGLKLYLEHGKSLSLKRTLNNQGYSEHNLGVLLEQLRIEGGISPDEFRIMLLQPVSLAAKQEIMETPVSPEEKEVFIREIPEQIRKTIRLRDDFPFLADPKCPDKFKILVHDMLTAYANYVDGHKRLFEVTTGDELQEVASTVVENYLENREIWDELNYYKENGKILGKHVIFSTTDRMLEIRNMTTADQVKLQKNLMNNIARTKQKIAEQPEHKNTSDRKASVAKFEVELTVVNGILGLSS